jgi:release factor glutamine methyltransferase
VGRIISDLLAVARQRLTAAPFTPSPREANLLLAHTLGWTEAQVLSRREQQLSEPEQLSFEFLLSRRLSGEPMAYIVGEREFFGRPFFVDDRVLIPRPETEHLVEAVLDLPLSRWPLIVDLGTGSGCLACTFALELPAAKLVAADISPAAIAVADRNRERHQLSHQVQLVVSDLAQALDISGVDLIVSNPPYVGHGESGLLSPEIRDFEPARALYAGDEGDLILQRLLAELDELPSSSWLVLEIGAGQGERIRSLCDDSPFRCHEILPDYAGHPRVAILRRV